VYNLNYTSTALGVQSSFGGKQKRLNTNALRVSGPHERGDETQCGMTYGETQC
jgi:hypothetical protein